MGSNTIRPAFSSWEMIDRRLRDVVSTLTNEQLALRPAPDRWPLWASIGHLACQRVFWLCDFAGAPGAESTRFTNAAFDCPGDDDLEHALDAGELLDALESTVRIVDGCLDTWTLDQLDQEIRHLDWGPRWVFTRGAVIQRVFSHDVYHIAEANETLGAAGLRQVDLWED